MRDKYIELIIEYIKEKPEYKSTLNEIKSDVLTVGATEEEFDEAIRRVTGVPDSSKLILEEQTSFRSEPKTSFYSNFSGKAKVLTEIASFHLKNDKKYIAGFSVIVIVILFLTQIIHFGSSKNLELSIKTPSVAIPKAAKTGIPIVYANGAVVDPDKIFSIKSPSKINLTVTGKPKKEVLGFFPYWMLPKQDQINLSTLTSISLFGLEVDGKGNIITKTDSGDDGGWDMWTDPSLNDLIKRAKSNDLSVYLTFKSFNDSNIEALSTSDTAQKNFIANAMYLVNSKNLDGINIDFEYVGIPSDSVREGFTRLITNLDAELKRQIPGAELSLDTYLVSGSEKDLFNIPILAQNSDAFVIMAYDMHTPLGAPRPVSAMGGDTNIVGYVQNYLEQVDSSKLILAVPYYGYDWPEGLASPSADLVNVLPYAEIAQQSQNLQLSWDDTSETPYFDYIDSTGQKRVVHFDNVRSLGIKYDFINSKNLKGVGLWALGYDGQNQDLQKLLIDKFINQ